MASLSDRQAMILKAIIEEFISSAEPVGSEQLERKYNMGVSPATIRNEMAVLTQQGFLKQPHTSAGRAPTAQALRLYISHMMQESQLSVAEEIAVRERLWESRHDLYQLMQTAVRTLSSRLHTVALVSLPPQLSYSAGYSNLLAMPEFYDIDVTRQVLDMAEQLPTWLVRLIQQNMSQAQVQIVFGEELNQPFLEPVGMVFAHFHASNRMSGAIGVIGPARMNFRQAIPWLKYYSHLFEDMLRDY